MSSTADTAPVLFRRPAGERVALARPFVGQRVVVVFDNWRDGKDLEELTGLLLTVARPYHGGAQSHVVALRTGGGDLAISIACVREIRSEP